ncbi:peptidyl-prolyl cis-trans isomerase FKBP42 [Tanacetum coccineum]
MLKRVTLLALKGQDGENEIISNGSSVNDGDPPRDGQNGEDEIVTEGSAFVHGGPSQDDNGPPKVDTEVEVLHEKVTKQIMKEGHGVHLLDIGMHYKAWTESTQHKFEDTWQELQLIELVIGKEKKEMTGLAIGLTSMKAGERALLHVGWELGYGEEGSFSFPNVPPKADIIYEVELVGFDETKETRGSKTSPGSTSPSSQALAAVSPYHAQARPLHSGPRLY